MTDHVTGPVNSHVTDHVAGPVNSHVTDHVVVMCSVCVMRVCSMYRLHSLQYDLGQQIKVDFERAFSVKGTPVSDDVYK